MTRNKALKRQRVVADKLIKEAINVLATSIYMSTSKEDLADLEDLMESIKKFMRPHNLAEHTWLKLGAREAAIMRFHESCKI
jgi:hypothetical protein